MGDTMKQKQVWIAAVVVAMAMLAPQAAISAEQVSTAGGKIGVLTCKTVKGSGINLLIHSTEDVKCEFRSTAGGDVEYYKGETGVGLGIDLNISRQTSFSYGVFAADFKAGTYQLAGKYGGAGGSATVGVGLGAQGLIGGNDRSVSLQPVISGSTGAGVTAGLTYLYLEPDKARAKKMGQ